MNGESEKPLRLLVNPFTIWTDLAFKTGEALWASAHAAVRANAPKVAVVPTADAPKVAVVPTADAPAPQPSPAKPRKARAAARQASKAVRSKAPRSKLRGKANARRRARR